MGWDERNGFGCGWIPSLLRYLVSAAPLVTHAWCGLGWAGDVYRLREHAHYELVGIEYFCLREYDVGQRESGGIGIGIGISIGVATSDNHHLSSLLILFQKIQTSHTKHTKHSRINKQQDQQTAQSNTK